MVVTKADVYEKVIFADRPVCPYCGRKMRVWECPETGLSCGSGWGTPYLFLCVNDDCPPFVTGWESVRQHYGRRCSYRCICFPDSRKTEMMMVLSSADCVPGLIDEEVISADKARGTDADTNVRDLRALFEQKNLEELMTSLFATALHYRVRMRAAEFIGELGETESIEPLKSHNFRNLHVRKAVERTTLRIHELNGTRECPYCREIIGAGSNVCPECRRPLD